jgi:tau tubulin kinase
MQVGIGSNKICHNFSSIISSAEIRDLNERVQQEHPQEGGGSGTQATSQRRVDPNAGVGLTPTAATSARIKRASHTARRSSLNLSRSSAGSRHHHHPRSQSHAKHSSTPHSRSVHSPSPDEFVLQPPPPLPSPSQLASRGVLDAAARPSAPPMAAVVSPSRRQSGNWSGAPRNGAVGSAQHNSNNNAVVAGENSGVNGGGHVTGHMNTSNSKNVAESNRRGDEVAAGSQDNNGSGNQDKPAQPAGPKLAQTKVQVGMRLRRWIIINRIGAGSFGETFTAMEVDGPIAEEDTLVVTPENLALLDHLPPPEERHEVCIKVEQENKSVLRLEALALKKVQPCPQVVRYLGSGCTNGMNFLVMEKLGPNLAELRRRSQHGTFNIYTTLKAGISCLTAIRGVHDLGLVHRDIKPSNFVTGLPSTPEHTTCYLIDFGLARRFRRSNGEIRPPRDNAGFRGTSRYASVASHHHQELGRVDDLWSLLFMLVEFATGTLPWRKYKDKDDIGRCKEESITPHLVRNLPREFQPFLAHLQTLRYEDEPDYDLLITLMHRALERRGYPPNKPVEWEVDPSMMDSGMDMDGHDAGGRNDAEKPPSQHGAPTPAQPSSQIQQPQHSSPLQQLPQVSNISAARNNAVNNSSQNTPAIRPVAVPVSNLSDTAARRGQQPLRTTFSPNGGVQTGSAGGGSYRGAPTTVDHPNAQAEMGINNGISTIHHQNNGTLHVSDVDVIGGGGGGAGTNRGSVAEASVPPPPSIPQLGTFEEPGAASGFAAEGSETPAARDGSSDDFDVNEFSPREQLSPANGDRDNHSRSFVSAGPSPAPVAALAAPVATASIAAAAVPPPNCAVEPNNSTQWKEAADRRSSGQPANANGDADAFSEQNEVMGKVGNAPVQRPMGGPAVDLDAPNNDTVELQHGADGKGRSKSKKKSNCDCKVM